jgi:hypothetical protein
MLLVIDPRGSVKAVYSELIDLATIGRPAITRASQVEPDDRGGWLADLGPVGGPVLGPFGRRSEALEAERAWLEANWLTRPC